MLDYDVSTFENPLSEIIIADKFVFNKSVSGSSEVYILEINSNDEIIKKFKILDEEFDVYSDGENIILTHPIWSLSGIGMSLIEAERNLYSEAKEIISHYSIPNSRLSPDAIKLKEFLNRLI